MVVMDLPDGLILDASKVTYGDAKKQMRAMLMLQRGQNEGNAEMFEQGLNAIDEFTCKVLVAVPDSWLSSDAPKGLTFERPEDLEWILLDKLAEIRRLTQELVGGDQNLKTG